MENIVVGVMFAIVIVAGIWVWRIDRCGVETDKKENLEKMIKNKDT